jgi:hypothetical protein
VSLTLRPITFRNTDLFTVCALAIVAVLLMTIVVLGVVPLKPITDLTEVSTQPPPMNERQAIVLVLVLSVGLWALIWGLAIGLQAPLTWIF